MREMGRENGRGSRAVGDFQGVAKNLRWATCTALGEPLFLGQQGSPVAGVSLQTRSSKKNKSDPSFREANARKRMSLQRHRQTGVSWPILVEERPRLP
jgi:hypothetical protein